MNLQLVYQIFFIVTYLIVFFIAIRILLDNRPPEVLLAWSLVLLLIPGLGIFLYIYGGIDWKKRHIVRNLPEESIRGNNSEILDNQLKLLSGTHDEQLSDALKSMTLIMNTNYSPVTAHNKVDFFFNGTDLFLSLFEDISNATSSICMEFYIWRSDEFGLKVMSLLMEKARAGVQVSLIFDGIGSFRKISYASRRKLNESGVRFKYFLDPSVLVNNLVINYRNHRKLVVIDDSIAYIGGYNIGKEYVDGGKKFDRWRDTHIRVVGESVGMMKDIFSSDWSNSGGDPLHKKEVTFSKSHHLFTQIVCSGPDSRWFSIEKLFINLISNANHTVLIQSPYFIPDRSMQNVIETAALSGVNIKIMITGMADKRLPFWVAETFFEPLIRAGVEFYRYNGGFLHSKMMVVDNSISTVGSCNFDIRSFRLAYEANAIFYDEKSAKTLSSQFEKDLESCVLIDSDFVSSFSIFHRLRNSFCRLFSPIL